MIFRLFQKICSTFLVFAILVGFVLRVDVVFGQNTPTRFGLVALLVDANYAQDVDLMSRVQRYSEDIQQKLPSSKVLMFRVDDSYTPVDIQSALERLYFEGDGAQNENNKLIGTVLIGDIPLPVVTKGDEIFPSIFPYVDFYRKQYIYDQLKDAFIENPLSTQPVPEIWHGIIKPPRDGSEGKQMLLDYFDRNHNFYTGALNANTFAKKSFIADFVHEKDWIIPEKISAYDDKMSYMELESYDRYTGALAQQIQAEQETRLRSQGFGDVFDVIQGKKLPASEEGRAYDQSVRTSLNVPQGAVGSEQTMPDIFSIHALKSLWSEFYQAAQKFAVETNAYAENSGRWAVDDLDTPVFLVSKKDKASQQIIYNFSNVLESAIDGIVKKSQKDVVLVDSYTRFLGGAVSYVNGTRVQDLQNAAECSLYLGSTQVIEANRLYNPQTADDTANSAGCNGRNINNRAACNPAGATRTIRDIGATALVTDSNVVTDYRACINNATNQTVPFDASAVNQQTISSVVEHKEPTGETLRAQLAAGFTKFLPIDDVRYTTYQSFGENLIRLDYPTKAIWSIESVDVNEIQNQIHQILLNKSGEIFNTGVDENLESFKKYTQARIAGVPNIDAAFENWKIQTLSFLKEYYFDKNFTVDEEYFAEYMLHADNLTQSQKDQIRAVYTAQFGAVIDFLGQQVVTPHEFFRTGDTVAPIVAHDFLNKIIPEEEVIKLADALYWKNLSLEQKHRYVLERYAGDEDPFVFNVSDGYESLYLMADGDATSMNVSVQAGFSVEEDDAFANVQRDVTTQKSELQFASQQKQQQVSEREALRCPQGDAEGVDIFLWIPYIICWAKDSFTPPFFYSDSKKNVPASSAAAFDAATGGTQIAVPDSLKIDSDQDTYASIRGSLYSLNANVLSQGSVMSDFSGGQVRLQIISGSDFIQSVGDSATNVVNGSTAFHFSSTGKVGKATVRIIGTFTKQDGKELQLQSDQLQISFVDTRVRIQSYVTDGLGRELSDSFTVGGMRGLIQVDLIDGSGNVRSDVQSGLINLAIDDSEFFKDLNLGSVTFQNGSAQFYFTTAQKSGIARIAARVQNVEAALISAIEISLDPGKFDILEITSLEPYVSSGSKTNIEITLKDEFGNVVVGNNTVDVSLDGVGSVSEQNPNVINGKTAVEYDAPLNVSQKSTVQIHAKSLLDSGEYINDTFEFTLLPEIRIRSKLSSNVTIAGGDQPVDVNVEVIDSDGNVLSDLSNSLVFQVLPNGFGRFSNEVVQLNGGKGTAQFYPSTRAGLAYVEASYPGYTKAVQAITVQPAQAAYLELKQTESVFNVFDSKPYTLEIRSYDRYGNLTLNDPQRNVSLKASDVTLNIAEVPTQVILNKGVGVAELTAKKGKSGELHLVAEGDNLIPGTLVLPLEARLTFEDLKNISFQALYGSVLGAPIGDSTQTDYLAGWFLFSGKMQALSAVNRKVKDYVKLFDVGDDGYFSLVSDQFLRVSYDSTEADKILIQNDSDFLIATLYPVFKNNSSVYLKLDTEEFGALMNGVNIFYDDRVGFDWTQNNGEVFLRDMQGHLLAKISTAYDLEIFDGALSLKLSDDYDRNVFAFDLMNGPQKIARIVFNVKFDSIKTVTEPDFNQQGLYVVLNDPKFQPRNIFTGSSTHAAKGIEVVDLTRSTDRKYGFSFDGAEDLKPGTGWKGDNKNMLLFASGNSVGDSNTQYLSDIEFVFGDPVVSLKYSNTSDNSSTALNSVGFDTTVGKMLYRDEQNSFNDLLLFDFDADGKKDVASMMTDGSIRLFQSLTGYVDLEHIGVLLKFPQHPKTVVTGDFYGDRFDDFIALMPDGKLIAEKNFKKQFEEEQLNLSVGNILSLASDDMNNDGITDIIVSNSRGEIYIYSGSSQGFGSTPIPAGTIGLQANSQQQLNHTSYLYYPGVRTPDFNDSSDLDNFSSSFYKPLYVDRSQSSTTLQQQIHQIQRDSQQAPDEIRNLQSSFFDALNDIIDVSSQTELPTNDVTYFLRSDLDSRLSVQKRARAVDTVAQSLGKGDLIQMSVDIQNQSSSNVRDITFADTLPEFYEFQSNTLSCEGCKDRNGDEVFSIQTSRDFSYLYDGISLAPNESLRITYRVKISDLPGVTFSTGFFNVSSGVSGLEDNFKDILARPEGGNGSTVIYFVSNRGLSFTQRIVRPDPITPPTVLNDIKKMQNDPGSAQQNIQDAFNNLSADNDNDGIPNLFDEVISQIVAPLASLNPFKIIPKAYAQVDDGGLQSEVDLAADKFAQVSDEITRIGDSVVESARYLGCGHSCLALPVSFAWPAPGPINVLGIPGGFSPDFPVIWDTIPFLPYQASATRIYVTGTTTLGLAISVCSGPYLGGQCYSITIPLQGALGQFCERLIATIAQVVTTVKNVQFDFAPEVDLGVISFKGETGGSQTIGQQNGSGIEYSGLLDNNFSWDTGEKKVGNKRIPSFPLFSDWWDRQSEEISNSLSNGPDIVIYLPDLKRALDVKSDTAKKQNTKKTNESGNSLRDAYDSLKYIPLIELKTKSYQLKFPFVDPNELAQFGSELQLWLLNHLDKIVTMIDSLQLLKCLPLDLGGELRNELKESVSSDLKNQIASNTEQRNFRGFPGDLPEAAIKNEGAAAVAALSQQITSKASELQRKWKAAEEQYGKDFATLDQCLNVRFGLDALLKLEPLIDSVQQNFDRIEEYRKFPRKIAKFAELPSELVSDLTNVVNDYLQFFAGWLRKNLDRIQLWVASIYTFEEYADIWEGLWGLRENYKENCNLCKSDRFTLQDFFLRLFAVFPELPVIPFPTWPDIILDFSDYTLGVPITLPLFDFVPEKIALPDIPSFDLPDLPNINVDLNVDGSLGVVIDVPSIPVLPPLPEIPDIRFDLPELPKVRLPVVPLPPKLPDLFPLFVPLMDIMKFLFEVKCLYDQAILPTQELYLRTQIENLTARSGNILLPIDLGLSLNATPLSSNLLNFIPEYIKLSTYLEVRPKFIDNFFIPFFGMMSDNWNNIVYSVSRVSETVERTLGEGVKAGAAAAQKGIDASDKVLDRTIDISPDIDVDLDLEPQALLDYFDDKKRIDSYRDEFQARLVALESPDFDAIYRESDTTRILTSLQSVLSNYSVTLNKLQDETFVNKLFANKAELNRYDHRLASDTQHITSFITNEPVETNVPIDQQISEQRTSLMSKSPDAYPNIFAQASQGAQSQTTFTQTEPSISLKGLYISFQGELLRLMNYSDDSAQQGDVLMHDFDEDGDMDVLYAYGSNLYIKKSLSSSQQSIFYPLKPVLKDLKVVLPQRNAVDMYRTTGDVDNQSQTTWFTPNRGEATPYTIEVSQKIDGFEEDDFVNRYFLIPDDQQLFATDIPETYPVVDRSGDVSITSLYADDSVIHAGDIIVTADNSELSFSLGLDYGVTVSSNTHFIVPRFDDGELSLQSGHISLAGNGPALFAQGYRFTTDNGTIDLSLGNYSYTIASNSTFIIPSIRASLYTFGRFEGDIKVFTQPRFICKKEETCTVQSGDTVHALFDSVLKKDVTKSFLAQGWYYVVSQNGSLTLDSGSVEIIGSDDPVEIVPYFGMRVSSNDRFTLNSSFHLLDGKRDYYFSGKGDLTIQSLVDPLSPRSTFDLLNGHYYSTIRSFDSNGFVSTVSPVIHNYPHFVYQDPVVRNNAIIESIPIFSTKNISAATYMLHASNDNVYFDLNLNEDADDDGDVTNDRDFEGLVMNVGPYNSIGAHDVMMNVARPDGSVIQKQISVQVYVPQLELSPISFSQGQLSAQVDPVISNYPVNFVRERNGQTTLIDSLAVVGMGPVNNSKYFTDNNGRVTLEPFHIQPGNKILDSDRNEIAKVLENNGRIILNDSLNESYKIVAAPSTVDYPVRTLLLNKDDKIVVSVYFVSEQDSDVIIDSGFVQYTKDSAARLFGTHIKPLSTGHSYEPIAGDADFYPGGVTIKNSSNMPVAFIGAHGEITLADSAMKLRVAPYADYEEPVVFELIQNEDIIAQIYISANFKNSHLIEGTGVTYVSDNSDRNQNGIVDVWERAYGLDGTSQENALSDPDDDTLTNIQEYTYGTNPLNPDTDNDGILDGAEIAGETNPLGTYGEEPQFTDVDESSPYFDAITLLYRQGIIQGFTDGTFRPDQLITRAEFLKIILGTSGCEGCVNPSDDTKNRLDPSTNNPDLSAFNNIDILDNARELAYNIANFDLAAFFHYPDVQLTDWFYYCVEMATEMGLVHGYKGNDDSGNNATGLFLPYENISRAEAVKVFLEAAKFDILSSDIVYDTQDESGNPISQAWYYDPQRNYVYTAVQNDLLIPNDELRVYPERKLTRGEMVEMAAKVLVKLKDLYGADDFDEDGIMNNEDSCMCLQEDIDAFEDIDGCPEQGTQEIPAPLVSGALQPDITGFEPANLPIESGVYIVKGADLCQFVEPISDVIQGDKFYSIISDSHNNKVWRISNKLTWQQEQ